MTISIGNAVIYSFFVFLKNYFEQLILLSLGFLSKMLVLQKKLY